MKTILLTFQMMHKRLIIFLLLLISVTVHSQSTFDYGITAGLGISELDFSSEYLGSSGVPEENVVFSFFFRGSWKNEFR